MSRRSKSIRRRERQAAMRMKKLSTVGELLSTSVNIPPGGVLHQGFLRHGTQDFFDSFPSEDELSAEAKLEREKMKDKARASDEKFAAESKYKMEQQTLMDFGESTLSANLRENEDRINGAPMTTLLDQTLDLVRAKCQSDTGTNDRYNWGGRLYMWGSNPGGSPRRRYFVCRIDDHVGKEILAERRYAHMDENNRFIGNGPWLFVSAQSKAILADARIDGPSPPKPEPEPPAPPPAPVVPDEWMGLHAEDLPNLHTILCTYYAIVKAMHPSNAEEYLEKVARYRDAIFDHLPEAAQIAAVFSEFVSCSKVDKSAIMAEL